MPQDLVDQNLLKTLNFLTEIVNDAQQYTKQVGVTWDVFRSYVKNILENHKFPSN